VVAQIILNDLTSFALDILEMVLCDTLYVFYFCRPSNQCFKNTVMVATGSWHRFLGSVLQDTADIFWRQAEVRSILWDLLAVQTADTTRTIDVALGGASFITLAITLLTILKT